MGNNIYDNVSYEKYNEIIQLVEEGNYGSAVYKIKELPIGQHDILLKFSNFSDELSDFLCGWEIGECCCNEGGLTCCGALIFIMACIGNGGDCGCCHFISNNICGC